jgi:hypothetical protein
LVAVRAKCGVLRCAQNDRLEEKTKTDPLCGDEKREKQKRNTGILDCVQDDGVKRFVLLVEMSFVVGRKATATATAGLSTPQLASTSCFAQDDTF